MSESRPVRLQLSRKRGFNLQALSLATNGLPAISVSRPSYLGNPFVIGEPSGWRFKDDGDPAPMIAALSREQCIKFYKEAANGFLSPEMHPAGHEWRERFRKRFNCLPVEAVGMLRGSNLACACGLAEACHADWLLEVSNRPNWNAA